MSGTQSTEQTVINADTARNAADILALIADYENEVDTVADDPVAEREADADRRKSGGSQPTTPVQKKDPRSTSAAAPVDAAVPTPARTGTEQRKSKATSVEPAQAASTQTEADTEAIIRQHQRARAQQLQSEAATSSPAGTSGDALNAEFDTTRKALTAALTIQTELMQELKAIKIQLADQEDRLQGDRSLAEQQREALAEGLASVKDCITELKALLVQEQGQGQQNDDPPSESDQTTGAGAASDTVQAELDSMRKVLTEALAVQTELAQEVKVIRTHLTDQSRSQDRRLLAEQMSLRADARANQARQCLEGDAFLKHCDQLNQGLIDGLSKRNGAQERINDQLQTANGTGDAENSECDTQGCAAHISQEGTDVLAIVSSLERQTARPSKLSDMPEGEIDSLKEQLSREKAARARLEEANRLRDALEADLLHKERQVLKDAVNHYGGLASAFRNQLLDQKAKLAAAHETIQQETAARIQTEEMLKEVKSRLLALSNREATESPLDLSGCDFPVQNTLHQDTSTVSCWKKILRACAGGSYP